MHIPDGYLSPTTCAVMYAGAMPFWWVAFKRVQRVLHTRLVPLISVFAAFCFVVMMFNLPLPGGTTGHAVGMGISAVVLGPWASVLAISVALLIQALFFGDGGLTAFGANCFNMAIVGSLAAFAIYRVLAGNSPLTSSRRVWAAALAGYAAINLAALCAAIEFGLQPALFHDASGAPLYCPYPLRVAIPAMLIGHLSFAGIAEAVVSGGVVAYLQRSNPSLLQLTARGASTQNEANNLSPEISRESNWRTTRPLWVGLALLMLLCPLGLLAAGTAWGEWSANDFSDPALRAQIAVASHHAAPPLHAPRGLEQMSNFWAAPMPAYAPPFLKSAALGYILSALFGCGLILATFLILAALSNRASRARQSSTSP